MSNIKPRIDADGVTWCQTEPDAQQHQCPAWRLQRCEAGGRPWGICSPAVREMARHMRLLPCGHAPDTYRDHQALCSRCEVTE